MPSATEIKETTRRVKRARRRTKPVSIVSNELIVGALSDFLADTFPAGGERVLDLGAGTAPYRDLYGLFFRESVTADVESSEHDADFDVIADAASLPFPDGHFDCVIATEVLEHCPYPHEVLKEMRRVLRPGGAALLTTPFVHGLHEMPHDYFRYTPPALRRMAEDAGFSVDAILPRGNRGAVSLLVMQWPLIKVAKALRLPLGVRRVLIGGPQLAFVSLWQRTRRRGGKMPLGYATRLRA